MFRRLILVLVLTLGITWGGVAALRPPDLDRAAPSSRAVLAEAAQVIDLPAPRRAPPPPPPPRPPGELPELAFELKGSYLVVDARRSKVDVFAEPGGSPTQQLPGRNPVDQAVPFLVLDETPGWYRVVLPARPNRSTGWLSAQQVAPREVKHALIARLGQFRLEHYVDGQLHQAFRVATGKPSTPTPTGLFYVWATQEYRHPPYDPGIFALSGFSPVLTNWPGGGRAGIHGWQDSRVIGKRASNGCLRMAPQDFQKLLSSVPLGTPVQILP
ncbi:MAG: L,D-transpeptidase [Actinomycetota bacterium]